MHGKAATIITSLSQMCDAVQHNLFVVNVFFSHVVTKSFVLNSFFWQKTEISVLNLKENLLEVLSVFPVRCISGNPMSFTGIV